MRLRENESGVMLILVAVAVAVMTGLASFAIDLGAAWYGRAQAQTAADAGALAGAVALEKDDSTWPFPSSGKVVTSAQTTVNLAANEIYQVSGTSVVTAVCPPYLVAPLNTNCVQVDVYRDGTNGSVRLPTYFANVFGTADQSVRATATAQIVPANTSGCMRPWFIPDKWQDLNANNVYDPGEFIGYNATTDIGTDVIFHSNPGPGAFGQLDVGSGAADISFSIRYCYAGNQSFSVGDVVPVEPGAKNGQKNAMDDLLSWDPDRSVTYPNGVWWDPVTKTVQGGCASTGTCSCPGGTGCPYNGTQSPRIVQAVMCHPSQTYCVGDNGNGTITITNILSFFITGSSFSSGDLFIYAKLIGSAGTYNGGAPSVSPSGSFLTFIRLVR